MSESAVSMRSSVSAVWMDGREILPEEATVNVSAHGLNYATAVFEGIRAYETADGRVAIFRLKDHLKRLNASAQAIDIEPRYSVEQLIEVAVTLVQKSGLKNAYIRPIIFLGEGIGLMQANLQVHTAILVLPWTTKPNNGLRLLVSKFRRPNPASTIITAKTSSHYESSRLAALEAQRKGFNDALQLDTYGHVAETTVANVFMLRGHVVITPVEGSILPGFTRDAVRAIVQNMNGDCEHEERYIHLPGLLKADEIFVAGTATEITPVIGVNEHLFEIGPITRQIAETYQRVVHGEKVLVPDWITWA
ncbi:MAG: aminotransferase class IV [Nanoarchaeota archaeon]|nr:aminotransferase class IV [Nanoarchaeota archaeon]